MPSYSSNISTIYKELQNNSKYIINEFNKPIFENRFYLNKSGLIYNSKIIKEFKTTWAQNPQNFCLDHYQNYHFYHIILLVNDIPSVFLFDKYNLKNDIIIAPKQEIIFQILGSNYG